MTHFHHKMLVFLSTSSMSVCADLVHSSLTKFNIFLDIVDKLLQYRLYDMMEKSGDMAHIARDLRKLNLLSRNDVKVIKSTHGLYDSNGIKMIAMMVSDNIVNGDKNDYSKFITYLKTFPGIKHLVEYLDRKCMFFRYQNILQN